MLVDLAELVFLDSTGVRSLHHLAQTTAGEDPALAIGAAMRPAVRQVLELTGVIALLPLEPSG